MTTLSQFSGFREIPLIPDPNEPAYFTTGYGQANPFLFNHNHQFVGIYSTNGGECTASTYPTQNWNSTPSSNSGWTYASTTFASMHGYSYITAMASVETGASYLGGMYYSYNWFNGGNFNGNCNSQITGVWVGKTKRDNLCIQRANSVDEYSTTFSTTQISTAGYGAIRCPITSTRAFNGVGSNGYSNNRSYGVVGYNETTKMWVVGDVLPTSASAASLKVYKNVQAPTLANTNDQTLWDQFNHSAKINVPYTAPSMQATHDYQHFKVFPLDNGNIAMIYKYEGTSINYRLFVGNDGVNSTSWTLNGSNTASISTTTSYHDSQFTTQDSLIALTSYDGQYVFVFTQYYYYFSGICGFVIRVSDGQVRKITHTDTTYSYTPAMIQADKMVMCRSVNTDGGAGNYLYQYDFAKLFGENTDNTDVTSQYQDVRVDNPYTSTCYPMIWTAQSYLPNFVRGVF